MPITAFYAALLAMLFMVLSFRTIQQRRNARVEVGTGEDAELLRRYRVMPISPSMCPLPSSS